MAGVTASFDPIAYLPACASKAWLTRLQIHNYTSYPSSAGPGAKAWSLAPNSAWTSGFYPGILWQLYNATRNDTWLQLAEDWTVGMAPMQYNNGTHDVGFMMYYSYGLGYQLTGNATYRDILLRSALSLSQRYNPIVGCTESWNAGGPYNYHFPVITDNLMNLELLLWAAANGGDPIWRHMAETHLDRAIIDNVDSRGDNATIHVIDYDPTTGLVLAKMNYPQGRNASNGCWSRGQAWAIYGYTMAYRYLRNPLYLSVAQGLANYYLANLPPDLVPLWDFSAPPTDPRDSSAAAIAASALVELSTYVEGEASTKYQTAALNILASLTTPAYWAPPLSPCLLINGTGAYPESNQSLIFGDYYFLEAILRYNYHYGGPRLW